jgi:hypothetical protein
MMKLFTFLTMAMMFCIFSGSAHAEFKDMWAYVYSWDGSMNAIGEKNLVRETSGITFKVLRADSDTAETLYRFNDDTMTSLTNPVSTTAYTSSVTCNDQVRFRVDPTDSGDEDVDLIVVNTSGGFTAFVEDFNQYKHTIVIDERPGIQQAGMIWVGASTAETDTGVDFLTDTLVEHVQIEVVTVDATETVDVGLLSSETNGDANGFLAGVSVATAGYPLVTLTTSGALMDDGTNFDPDGHVVTGANAVSLTHTGSAGSDTFAGYIHYMITRLR